MLKNILGRIKSQKQSSTSNKCQVQNNEKQQVCAVKKLNCLQLINSGEQKNIADLLQLELCQSAKSKDNIVYQQMQRITYFYNIKIPNISMQVMGCPISHFTLLTYSQRKVKEIDLNKDNFPTYLQFMRPILNDQLPTYNHLLINWYPKGVGIMHHFDGPAYKDKVVVISLGGPALISFCQDYKRQDKRGEILLQDKSIHIFQLDAYNKCLHGIQNYKIDSIYLRVDIQQSKLKSHLIIDNSSIDNLSQTYLYRNILLFYKTQIIQKLIAQSNQEISLHYLSSKGQATKEIYGSMIWIKQNNQYNCKIQIVRKQRISITIREKFN